MKKQGNGFALLPFLIFIVIYLGAGLLLQARGQEMTFYQFPSVAAMFIAAAGGGRVPASFIIHLHFIYMRKSLLLADFSTACGSKKAERDMPSPLFCCWTDEE